MEMLPPALPSGSASQINAWAALVSTFIGLALSLINRLIAGWRRFQWRAARRAAA